MVHLGSGNRHAVCGLLLIVNTYIHTYIHTFDSGLSSQPGLFRSALAQGSARAGLVKSVDLLMSYKSESTYPHGQSFGSKMLFLIRLAWEASEI